MRWSTVLHGCVVSTGRDFLGDLIFGGRSACMATVSRDEDHNALPAGVALVRHASRLSEPASSLHESTLELTGASRDAPSTAGTQPTLPRDAPSTAGTRPRAAATAATAAAAGGMGMRNGSPASKQAT